MNTKTFDNRTKQFRGTVALGLIRSWINDGEKIRPCYTTGSGRYCKNSDHADNVKAILSALKLPYTLGNDAPRGGLCGQWIKVDAPGWGKMKPIRDTWQLEAAAKIAEEEAEKQAKEQERAAHFAGLAGDDTAIFRAWWASKMWHPAPAEVMQAKQRSGLNWKEIAALCKG